MTNQNIQREAMEYNERQHEMWEQERLGRMKQEDKNFIKTIHIYTFTIFFFGMLNLVLLLFDKVNIFVAAIVPGFTVALMVQIAMWQKRMSRYSDEKTK